VAISSRTESGTASRILDVAERLVQLRGFNGFSYADVATELGITKPALHYHFTSKATLGEALLARYTDNFTQALARLEDNVASAPAKLAGYATLYADVLRRRRMCLCGMLAAEYQTLPAAMQNAVVEFFDRNETWLATVLDQGRADGSLRFTGSVRDTARLVVSCLEGAMLLARPRNDTAGFQSATTRLIASLLPAGADPAEFGTGRSAAPRRRAEPTAGRRQRSAG
jgi:TetR/AcrR family transcriptional regulator, transcriptional repressor for nem operon